MVAPLALLPYAVGIFGLSSLGWFGAKAFSEVIFWGSALVGLFVLVRTLQLLVMERPLDITTSKNLNNIFYLIFAGAVGLIVFQVLQAIFVTLGITAVMIAGFLFIVFWVFGAGAVISIINFVVAMFIQIRRNL